MEQTKQRRGRPKVFRGKPVPLALTEKQAAAVEAESARLEIPRAEVIRQLINKGLLDR